jgi:hypothetical protein
MGIRWEHEGSHHFRASSVLMQWESLQKMQCFLVQPTGGVIFG